MFQQVMFLIRSCFSKALDDVCMFVNVAHAVLACIESQFVSCGPAESVTSQPEMRDWLGSAFAWLWRIFPHDRATKDIDDIVALKNRLVQQCNKDVNKYLEDSLSGRL